MPFPISRSRHTLSDEDIESQLGRYEEDTTPCASFLDCPRFVDGRRGGRRRNVSRYLPGATYTSTGTCRSCGRRGAQLVTVGPCPYLDVHVQVGRRIIGDDDGNDAGPRRPGRPRRRRRRWHRADDRRPRPRRSSEEWTASATCQARKNRRRRRRSPRGSQSHKSAPAAVPSERRPGGPFAVGRRQQMPNARQQQA